jgi:wyosine [tRNA(Phe)-imidazoG37] synthetase (radical SAM superfamily)
MTGEGSRCWFGPVPSRRLGRSLGINNIPPKVCTYSCVYCQVGRSTEMPVERRAFREPRAIYEEVRDRCEQVSREGERIDYLTFVPEGEPTLDRNLGDEIARLKKLGIPVGVITNGSLIDSADVREELRRADWVSLKIDAVRESTWRRINRPHRSLDLAAMLEGMREFAKGFEGTLVTETMLVEGINDDEEGLEEIAGLLRRLRPWTAYLSVPTRPPAEEGVRAPDEETLNRAWQIVARRLPRVEHLIGYEGDAFATTGDAEKDLLGITAVHPMRREAVETLLCRAGADWSVIEALVARGDLAETVHEGHRFYVRRYRKTGRA